MLFNHLVLIVLAPLALAQLPDGSTCAVNGDCNSRLCNVPFAGPGDIQCLPRPAPNTASCDKSLEATDCESGFCDDSTLQCADVAIGSPCDGNQRCQNDGICDRTIGNNQNQVCLETNLSPGSVCNVDVQCAGDEYFCVAPDYTCAIPPDPSKALEGEDCENDPDCESGICDDEIVNNGYKKVCLPRELILGLQCSVDRQCFSGYCVSGDNVPANAQPQTCAPEELRPKDTSPPETISSSRSPDVVIVDQPQTIRETVTEVQNGQTQTVVRTRTTTVAGSRSGSASARSSSQAASGAERGMGASAVIIGGTIAALAGVLLLAQ